MIVYVARDGAEIGEHPRENLDQLAREGELFPTDLCWFEGMEDWLLLEDFLGPAVWKAKKPPVDFSRPTAPAPLRPARVKPAELRAVSPRPRRAPRIPQTVAHAEPPAPESRWIFIGALVCVALICIAAIAIKLSRPANTEPPPVSLLSVSPAPDKAAVDE